MANGLYRYVTIGDNSNIYITEWRRWEDNIRMDLQEGGCGRMDWIELAQDRDIWREFENAVMYLRVP
jgi:hypothetical protein